MADGGSSDESGRKSEPKPDAAQPDAAKPSEATEAATHAKGDARKASAGEATEAATKNDEPQADARKASAGEATEVGLDEVLAQEAARAHHTTIEMARMRIQLAHETGELTLGSYMKETMQAMDILFFGIGMFEGWRIPRPNA